MPGRYQTIILPSQSTMVAGVVMSPRCWGVNSFNFFLRLDWLYASISQEIETFTKFHSENIVAQLMGLLVLEYASAKMLAM